MILNLPNILSLSRIAAAPVFFVFLVSSDSAMVIAGCILYFAGAFTDYIDGWLARKYGIESSLGKFLDPLADKILTTAAFLVMVFLEIIPLWMVIIVIIRDFVTTLLRAAAEAKGIHIATLRSAKIKTFIQMTYQFLVFGLFLLLYASGAEIFREIIYYKIFGMNAASVVMFFLTIVTVWTLVEYIIKNKNVISSIMFNVKENQR